LKTNKKQILRSAQDDMLGGFFSSLLDWKVPLRWHLESTWELAQ